MKEQRVDGFLSNKAAAFWGQSALVVVVAVSSPASSPVLEPLRARQRFELQRDGETTVVLGWSFKQAQQGLGALIRVERLRRREREAEASVAGRKIRL